MAIGNNKPHVTDSSVSSTSKSSSIGNAPKGWALFTDKAAAKATEQAGIILGGKFSPEIHQKMGTDILRLHDTINTLNSDSSSSKISLSQFIETTKSIEKSIQTINDRLIRNTKSAPGKDTYDPMLNSAEKLALIKLKSQLATIKSNSGGQLVTTEKTRLANTIATIPALDRMDSFLKTASQSATDLAELNESIEILGVPDTTATMKTALEENITDRVDYIERSPDLTPLDIAIVIDQMNAVWTANKAMKDVLDPGSSYTKLANRLTQLADEYPQKIRALLLNEKIDEANAMRDGLAEALDLVPGLPQVATAITRAKTALTESKTAIAKFNLDRHVTTIEKDLVDTGSVLDQIEKNPHQLAETLQHQLQELESLEGKVLQASTRPRSGTGSSMSSLTSSSPSEECKNNLVELIHYANSLATLKDAENAIPDTKTAKKSQTAASVKESLDHLDRALQSTNSSQLLSISSHGSPVTSLIASSITTRPALSSSRTELESRLVKLTDLHKNLSAIEAMDKQVAALSRGSIQEKVKALSSVPNSRLTQPNKPTKEYTDAETRLTTATATTIRDAKKAIDSALKPPLQSQTTYGWLRGQNALTSAHANQVREGVELLKKLQGILPAIDLSNETDAVATLSTEITRQVDGQIGTINPTADSALPQLLELKAYCLLLPESVGATALKNVNTQLAGRGAKIQRDINTMIEGYTSRIPNASDPEFIDNLSAQVEILKKTLPADKFRQAVQEIKNVMEANVAVAITAAMLTSYTNTDQLETLGKIYDTVQSMRNALGVGAPTPDTVLDALKVKSNDALDAALTVITTDIDTLDFKDLTERQEQIDALSTLVSKKAQVALGFADKSTPATQTLNLQIVTKIDQQLTEIKDDANLPIHRQEMTAFQEFLDKMNENQFATGEWSTNNNVNGKKAEEAVTVGKATISKLLAPNSDGAISATILDITSLVDADPTNAAKQLTGLKVKETGGAVGTRTTAALTALANKIGTVTSPEEKIQLSTAMLKLESGVKTTEMETILKDTLINGEFQIGLRGIGYHRDQIKQLAKYSDAISGMGLPEASRKALQTELWSVANAEIRASRTVGPYVSAEDIESAKTLLRLGCDGTLGAYANNVATERSIELGKKLGTAFLSAQLALIQFAAAGGKELLKADTNGTADTFKKILEDKCTELLTPTPPGPLSIKDLYIVHTALTASAPVKLPDVETDLLKKLQTLCTTTTANSLDDLKMLTELSTAYGKHKQPNGTENMSVLFSTAKATVAAAWATQFNSDVTAAITKYDEISARTLSSDKMQIMSKSGASAVLAKWEEFDALAVIDSSLKSLPEVAELRPSIGFFKIKKSESAKFERIREAGRLVQPPPVGISRPPLNRAQIAQIIAVLKENQAPNEDNIPKEQRDKMTAAIKKFFDTTLGTKIGQWQTAITAHAQYRLTPYFDDAMKKIGEVHQMLVDATPFMAPQDFANAVKTLGQAILDAEKVYETQTVNATAPTPEKLKKVREAVMKAMILEVRNEIAVLKQMDHSAGPGAQRALENLNKLLGKIGKDGLNALDISIKKQITDVIKPILTEVSTKGFEATDNTWEGCKAEIEKIKNTIDDGWGGLSHATIDQAASKILDDTERAARETITAFRNGAHNAPASLKNDLFETTGEFKFTTTNSALQTMLNTAIADKLRALTINADDLLTQAEDIKYMLERLTANYAQALSVVAALTAKILAELPATIEAATVGQIKVAQLLTNAPFNSTEGKATLLAGFGNTLAAIPARAEGLTKETAVIDATHRAYLSVISKVAELKANLVAPDPITVEYLNRVAQFSRITGDDTLNNQFHDGINALLTTKLNPAEKVKTLANLLKTIDKIGDLPASTQGVISGIAIGLCDQITIPLPVPADDVFVALDDIVAKLGPAVLLPLATKATAAPLSAETLNVMARLLSLSQPTQIKNDDGNEVLSTTTFKTKLDEFIPINVVLVTGGNDFLSRERGHIDAIRGGFSGAGTGADTLIQAKEQSISIAAKLHQLYKLYMLKTAATAAPDYLIPTVLRTSQPITSAYINIQLEASKTTTIGDLFARAGIEPDGLPPEFLSKMYKQLDDDLLNPVKNRPSMAGGHPAGFLGAISIPNSAGKTNIAALDTTFNATLNADEHSFERKITNGDGSCGLHGLFAENTNEHGQLTLENVMAKRAELLTKFDGTSPDFWEQPDIKEILEQIAMERGMPDTSDPAAVKNYVRGIFNIQLKLTGEDTDAQRDGQIHLSELKLIAKMYNLNVWILAGKPDNVSEFQVWHSKPGDATPEFAVVHSGGAHWERWNIGDPIVGVVYTPDGDNHMTLGI